VRAKVAGVAGIASLHQAHLVMSMTATILAIPLEHVQIANANARTIGRGRNAKTQVPWTA